MDSRRYILILLISFAALSLKAHEVSENTRAKEHSPLTTLIENVESVGVYNAESGTVRLTGHLAEQLEAQVVQQVEQSRQESNEEEAIAFAKLQAIERGPAIVSADAIIGEQEPENYPSFVGVPGETTKLGDELPLKPSISSSPIDTGNLKGVTSVLNAYQENSAGKLPIPYKTAPSSTPSSQKAKSNQANDESPYEESNVGTTFGRNPSDDTAISDLVKKKENLAALEAALKRDNDDLKALDAKEKERLEKEKKEKETKERMSKIKDIQNDPYDLQDYRDVRELFEANPDMVRDLATQDPAFAEKVAEIANFVPPGSSDGKSFSEMDSERKKKKNLVEFVEGLETEAGDLFPSTKPNSNKRIRVERAH